MPPRARSLQESDGALSTIRSGIDGLRAVVQKIRAELSEPHRQVATRTRQLAALTQTVELLHNVIRVLKLTGARARPPASPPARCHADALAQGGDAGAGRAPAADAL